MRSKAIDRARVCSPKSLYLSFLDFYKALSSCLAVLLEDNITSGRVQGLGMSVSENG